MEVIRTYQQLRVMPQECSEVGGQKWCFCSSLPWPLALQEFPRVTALIEYECR